MSAKINLLPDTRQAKLRAKQRKQLAISAAIGSVVVVAIILVIGFLIIQGQNIRISALTSSISSKKAQIKSTPNVENILSLQARAAMIPQLYSQRVYMTKLLTILSGNEPLDVAYSSLSFSGNNVTIGASGRSYLSAAKIALALQQAKTNGQLDFTNVTLSAVTLNGATTSYSITATANPEATNGK